MGSFDFQNREISGYKIQERIGLGGMGEVYMAYHPGLHRMAAVKFLFKKDQAQRFKNEAYIQSSVNHPNIAKLYEYTLMGDTPCIIMEYVDGVSLDAYIKKYGRIGSSEAERILGQVCSALKYLHDKNIVHRDIKPSNFKIEKDGTVKMLDFGISKNQYTPRLTQMGFVVGTTEYMAPEQFEHKVDKKSDIWSVGVMAYEMVTGSLPFDSGNPAEMRSQIIKARFTDPRILVPLVSEKLQHLISHCLRTNPATRPSARELEELLSPRHAETENPEIKKIHLVPALTKWVKPKWIYLGTIAAAVIVFIVLFSSTGPASSVTKDQPIPVEPNPDEQLIEGAKTSKVKIAVNNTQNAEIILPDGSRKAVPTELQGRPGESYNVILRAEGYKEKLVPVTFLQTTKIYTYSLDKKIEE